jgi:Zn-dependent protease
LKRSQRIELFAVAGIQLAIDYSWLVTFGLVLVSLSAGYLPHRHPGHGAGWYWGIGVLTTLLFFFSIVIHELAQALVGNRSPARRCTG